jgi:hypothetical protein
VFPIVKSTKLAAAAAARPIYLSTCIYGFPLEPRRSYEKECNPVVFRKNLILKV